jgi:hypothetical protein
VIDVELLQALMMAASCFGPGTNSPPGTFSGEGFDIAVA